MTDGFRIASWNINGMGARAEVLRNWLRRSRPEVVLLQETKIEDRRFPAGIFEDEGYSAAFHGQKSFNGVAILSRFGLEDVAAGLPGDSDDAQARWLEATVMAPNLAVRLCSAYLPNGNPAPGPKYDYKLGWMQRLDEHAARLRETEMAVVVGGDFNVVPAPIDAANPDALREDAVFLPEARDAWHRIVHAGWTDSLRLLHPEPGLYSYWDYQAGAWRKNRGIRIDHLLLSPTATDCLEEAGIEHELRGEPRPSDHVPVWCRLNAAAPQEARKAPDQA